MLAIKKHLSRSGGGFAVLALACLLAGCTPPGPRAMLEGDRLLRQGKYSEAIERLEVARRHMDRDPRVYHWLGMAYQGAGDFTHAASAYRQALALDAAGHSYLVFVAHYNLGCLYLDQGSVNEAINELRSYCSLSNSAEGLLKLGQAELRARQFDAAERTLGAALRWQPNDPAILNALGMLNSQRSRVREAAQFFQGALRADPRYGPALLNLAIVYHQQPAQRMQAVQKYREYLALQPRPANAEAVRVSLAQLEQDLGLNRPPVTNGAAAVTSKTNETPAATNRPAVTLANTNPPSTLSNLAAAATNVIRPVTNLLAARTNPPALVITQQVIKPVVPVLAKVPTNPVPTVVTSLPTPSVVLTSRPPEVARVTQTVAVVTSAPPILAKAATAAAPAVAEVKVTEPSPYKPAADITNAPTVREFVPAPPPTDGLYVVKATPEKTAKKSFFQKINPFGKGDKPAKQTSRSKASVLTPTITNVPANPSQISAASTNAERAATAKVAVPLAEIPRYTYLSPPKPAPGNRTAASPFFAEGVKAHERNQTSEALKAYRSALERDPSYYEAWYNISLIALASSDWKAAMTASEAALAIDPKAVNARINLGVALDAAKYTLDAVEELEKAIEAKPDEARAHLALANIYAQKLGETDKARAHYRKVLELEPNHPRSIDIRYWLAAHP